MNGCVVVAEPLLRFPLASGVDPAEVARSLGDHVWYHRIGLGDDLVTPGVERYEPFQAPVLERLRRVPLRGRRVLDLGARDGLFAFEAERLGASDVVALDNNPSTGARDVVAPALGSSVRFVARNLLDVTPGEIGGPFDVVLLAGVLYHLRDPFTGLRRVAALAEEGGTLIIETAVLLGGNRWATLWCPSASEGPYERSSPSFFNRKGLEDTLRSTGFEVTEFARLGQPGRHPQRWRSRVKRRGWRRVDRATVVATKRSELVDPDLEAYFHGMHRNQRWS